MQGSQIATLRKLLDQLIEDDRPVAKLVAAAPLSRPIPKLGTQRGSVLYMAPDFDAPLDDFKEYME